MVGPFTAVPGRSFLPTYTLSRPYFCSACAEAAIRVATTAAINLAFIANLLRLVMILSTFAHGLQLSLAPLPDRVPIAAVAVTYSHPHRVAIAGVFEANSVRHA